MMALENLFVSVLKVLMLVAGLPCASGFGCPRECECISNGDPEETVSLDCSGRDLPELPYPLPNKTTHLDVSGNIIQYIRIVDFSPQDTSLKFLQLQNNDLLDIQSEAFRRLINLETLVLSNNNRLGVISELRDGVFNGLQQLTTLSAFNLGLKDLPPQLFSPLRDIVQIDLRFNQLEEISAGDFSDLKRLLRIDLSGNFISTIEPAAFSNLPSLLHLDLSNNQLKSITEGAFSGLTRIRSIDLTGNPIECGCSAAYLHTFFTSMRLRSPVCQEPPQFRGVALLSLDLEEICVLPTAAVFPNETLVLANGSAFSLTCLTSGTPPPSVTWSRDGMALEEEETRVMITGATLRIASAERSDSGEYHCSATSSAGLVSSSVLVQVLGDTQPVSTMAVVREDVVLDCSSELPPGAPVRWSFNMSTLAAVSSGHVVLQNGSLLLVEVWIENMGDYVCEVGQVQLTRTLLLTAAPEITVITEGPCSQPDLIVVTSDNSTVLLCEAFGIPPPQVTWEHPPSTTITTSVTSNPLTGGVVSMLTLNMPFPSDEGNFTCTATNDVGTVARTLQVRVQVIPVPGERVPSSSIMAFPGDTLILECLVAGFQLGPTELVLWRDGVNVPLFLDGLQFACRNNETLIVQGLMRTQIFACVLADTLNPIGRFTVSFVAPPSVDVCVPPTTVAMAGQNVTLLCLSSGVPTLDRVWSRDGELVETGGRVTLLDEGERLHISGVREEDSGMYICEVSNVIQNQTRSDNYTQILEIQKYDCTEWGESSAVLWGAGQPRPSVSWHRILGSSHAGMAQEIVSDDRLRIGDLFLLFTEVQLADEGFYFCNLTSPLGMRISAKAFFNVYMSPVIQVPASEYVFELGSEGGVLECSGEGDPQPDLQWLRLPDMTRVPSSGLENYALNGSNLVIVDVREETAGVYRCWVANVAGQVTQDVTVSVIAPPRTRVEPEGVVASVGCQEMFRCLDGDTPPLLPFQWTFNGVPVETTPPGVMVGEEGTLVLSGLRVEDSGTYACTVFGPFSNTTAVSMLSVVDPLFPPTPPPSLPSISSPTPPTQLVPPGQLAQFVCLVGGSPPPEVTWLGGGVEIVEGNGSRIEIVGGRVLVISNITSNDSGIYTCHASNTKGNTSRDFALEVTAAPELVVTPEPQRVLIHSILTLRCEATGNPLPTILWLLNGSVISSEGRREIDPETNTLTVLNTLVAEDTGFYSCLAWNQVGSDQHASLVQVLEFIAADNASEFSMPEAVVVRPESQTLETGSPLVVDCIPNRYPPPPLLWLRDGEELPLCPLSRRQVCVERAETTFDYIYIPSAEEGDSGVYACQFELEGRTYLYSADITVLPVRSAPFFLTSPSSEHVSAGDDVTLDCVVGGSPPPEVTWLRNMAAVNVSGPRFQQLDNNSLVLLEVTDETAGFFTCRAENSVGLSQFTVVVVLVQESPANTTDGLSVPVVTSFPLGTLTLFQGQSTALDCTASGNPPPSIVWSRNGRPLDFALFPSLSLAPNGSLLLRAVLGPEEGNYTCTATNQLGTYEVHFAIDVAGVVSGASSRTSLTGSRLVLDCEQDRSSAVSVVWQHEEKVVHNSQLRTVLSNGSLLISAVRREHAGLYNCQTSTARGWSHTTVRLYVQPRKEPPFFTASPQALRTVKKGFVILPCAAESPGGEDTTTHWRHAETNITRTGTRHRVLQDGSLLLVNVRVGDGGEYVCVGRNEYGVSTTSAQLTITRSKVEEEVVAKEGSTVLLVCGEGEEKRVQWLKDSTTPLSADKGRVWLHSVNHTHEGEYTCSYGKTTHNYYVTVQATPVLTTPPMAVSLRQGDTAVLHCAATGKPPPTISWHYGGRQLERDHSHSILANGTLLVYEMVRGRDEGVYTCRANNTVGVAEQQSRIVII